MTFKICERKYFYHLLTLVNSWKVNDAQNLWKKVFLWSVVLGVSGSGAAARAQLHAWPRRRRACLSITLCTCGRGGEEENPRAAPASFLCVTLQGLQWSVSLWHPQQDYIHNCVCEYPNRFMLCVSCVDTGKDFVIWKRKRLSFLNLNIAFFNERSGGSKGVVTSSRKLLFLPSPSRSFDNLQDVDTVYISLAVK